MARKQLAEMLAGRSAEELLVELLSADEELEVANAELRAQNQELRNARAALEADCRRYRDLFNFAPDGYLITDPRGTILEANHTAAELLGVEQGHLPGQPLATYLNEPDVTDLRARMRRLPRGQVEGWETHLFPRGSKAIDVAVKVSTDANDDDVPAALRWSIRDITEHKRVPAAEKDAEAERVRAESEREAALRARERLVAENRRQREFLERLIEAVPFGIAVLRGPEHRFELANPHFRAIPGLSGLPLVGRTAAEVFPEPALRGTLKVLDEVYCTGQTVSVREHLGTSRTPREDTYWDSDHVPLRDRRGEIEGVLVLVREVTEQVHVRQPVEALAARDQAILESMGEALVIFDLEGNILEMNPTALRLHGFENVEDVCQSIQCFGPLFDLYDLDGHLLPVDGWPLSRVLAGDSLVDFEVLVHNLFTGTEGVWSYNGSPVRDSSGEFVLGILTIRDVTRQKDLETLLRRQFAFLEQLVAEAPVGIAVVSGPDHRYEFTNRQYMAIPGSLDVPILGQTLAEAFPELVALGALEMVDEVYRTGQTVSAQEYEVAVGPGREQTHWNVHLVPLFDANGQVERVLILVQEATEQVQARHQIEELAARSRRQAELLEAIFEAMVEGVVVYDTHTAVMANRAAREAYGPALDGRDRPEIIRLLNLRHLDGQPVALDESPVDRALRGEVVQGDRYYFAHAQKDDCIMAASAAPLHEGDRVLGAVVVWHDITDQVRGESQREAALQAARASEEKLRTLIEILPLKIVALDRESRVTQLNPGRAAILELPSVALAEGTYREGTYIRPDGSPLPPTEFPDKRALDEQQVVRSVEFGAVQQDGRVLWANVSAAPLPFDDWRAIVAGVDVTEQMEAKQALERRHRELQELTGELEAYDHTVAHDLKNPLASVMGLADLLAANLADLEGGPQRMLHGIVEGTMRMGDIVDSLLLLSSARSQEVEVGRVNMGKVVAHARQELASLAKRRGAQIAMPEEWPAARGYAPWLQRVWVNYLSNAIKYGGEPPRIELGAELCPPPGKGPGQRMVRFWVRDHGPGLTEEQQARLFVEFSRLDRPEKLGHGLGLAIVRRVMERLGGQVGVKSRPGEGSTFWFTLPAE